MCLFARGGTVCLFFHLQAEGYIKATSFTTGKPLFLFTIVTSTVQTFQRRADRGRVFFFLCIMHSKDTSTSSVPRIHARPLMRSERMLQQAATKPPTVCCFNCPLLLIRAHGERRRPNEKQQNTNIFWHGKGHTKKRHSLSARDVPIPFGFSFSFFSFFSSVLLLATSHLQKCLGEIRAREKRETRRMDRRFFLPKTIGLKSQRSHFTLCAVYERPHIV